MEKRKEMDDKLRVMQDLVDEISELNSVKPSTFASKSAEAQQICDDIIHKLLLIRRILSNPKTSTSRGVMTTYALLNGDRRIAPSPLSSRKSSLMSLSRYLVTHAVLNDDEQRDPREVARTAYDCDNYAKCIRTIEKLAASTDSDNQIDREMMNLCHDSYKKIVEAAPTDEERHKLCEWWRLFLENIHLSDSSRSAQLQLIDCKIECLWERQKLATNDSERLRFTQQLMSVKIEAYELTATTFRPFHIKCLRRIQQICALIVDYFERFPDSEHLPLSIEEGIELSRYALDEAKVDAVSYAKETQATLEDLGYFECIELVKEIEMVLNETGCTELAVHSDTEESDEVLSSEDGGEHDSNSNTSPGKCYLQSRFSFPTPSDSTEPKTIVEQTTQITHIIKDVEDVEQCVTHL